ncbi:Mitochondrial amidoxime-reducing component 1 [Orchesella cincta]|uniref:Mitochondrial amidoxime-reducing component 1 n=1 Tax=Orchesella cincta TaxID=48709 RepID=A0A1D2MJQ0_ORCCI|nr:Mitochondrial amidoxime-reducing component 1 [Orchesella cincta]
MYSGNINLVQSSTAVSALCISSLAALLTSAWLWKKTQLLKTHPKPQKWVKVGTVGKLHIYPIKSCSAVNLEKAVLTQIGLKSTETTIMDRKFMVVDETRKQVTMVKFPRMSLIKPEIGERGKMTLSAPDMPSITFTVPKPDGNNERVCRNRLDPDIKALDCGNEVAQWLQEYLGDTTLRLYFHHLNHTQRRLEPYMLKCPQFQQSDMGAFSNETAYLLLSEASVDELNKRLEKEVSHKNFRPNILISQVNEPFAEVNWSFVKIGNGNAILKACVPCKRCPLTTVDQDAGVMSKDGEPLKTLRK